MELFEVVADLAANQYFEACLYLLHEQPVWLNILLEWNVIILLYRLLNTFAEEQSTEDAIYYLQEGLKRGVIDLDVFLKVCWL